MKERGLHARIADWIAAKLRSGAQAIEGDPEENYAEMRSGILTTVVYIVNTALLIVLSLWLRIVPEVLLFVVVYGLLRSASFGFHWPKAWICLTTSMVEYIGLSLLAKWLPATTYDLYWRLGIWVLCLVVVIRYAPAPTKKRPLPKSHYKPYQIASIVAMLLFGVAIALLTWLGQSAYANVVTFAIACQAVYLLPVLFRYFETPTNEKG